MNGDRGIRSDRAFIAPMAACVAVALAVASGCDRSGSLPAYEVHEVTGKVLLADGKPLGGGWIYFVPKGDLPVTPAGEIGPDGAFSLVTGGSGSGAPAGDYKIRVEAPQLAKPAARAGKTSKPIIPARYADEDGSGLVVTVRAGANHLDPITLK